MLIKKKVLWLVLSPRPMGPWKDLRPPGLLKIDQSDNTKIDLIRQKVNIVIYWKLFMNVIIQSYQNLYTRVKVIFKTF